MQREPDPLPYPEQALKPCIGEETVALNYHKHHAGCLANLIEAVGDVEAGERELIDFVNRPRDENVFRNAAQSWNHCSSSTSGSMPAISTIATSARVTSTPSWTGC